MPVNRKSKKKKTVKRKKTSSKKASPKKPVKAKRKKTKNTKRSARKKEIVKPVSKTETFSPEEEAEVIREQLQDQIDNKLPSNFHIADAGIPNKKTYYVWVRGRNNYPKLKFTCVDSSEAIRQYRAIVDVKNPSRQNYGVEEFEKE